MSPPPTSTYRHYRHDSSQSNETYLESFLEHLSFKNVSHDLRRNLELLRSMDADTHTIVEALEKAEQDYLQRLERSVLQCALPPLQEAYRNKHKRKHADKHQQSDQQKEGSDQVMELNDKDKDKDKDQNNDNEQKNKGTTGASEGQAEEDELSSEESSSSDDDSDMDDSSSSSSSSFAAMDSDDDDDDEEKTSAVIVPTTEEFVAMVEDPQAMGHMAQLRHDARRYMDEKVAIAEQTYDIVYNVLQRLDQDLIQLEALLKTSGEFETSGAKPNDLAAIQVHPNTNDWILAKVITHDLETGMYSLSDEDVESNKIFHLPESQVVVLNRVERLSRGDIVYAVYPDTTSFYQATVVQPPRKGPTAAAAAAAASSGALSSSTTPSSAAGGGSGGGVGVGGVGGGDGSGSGGGASAAAAAAAAYAASAFVMVAFSDDGDEHGVTHDKAVLLKHVMRPPMGSLIS